MSLGFEPTKKTKKKVEEPNVEETPIDQEQEQEDVASKPKVTKPQSKRTGPVTVDRGKNNNNTMIIAICGAVVVVILGIVAVLFIINNNNKKEVVETPPPVEIPKPAQEDAVNVGLPNLNVITNEQNVASLTDPGYILKDINDAPVDTDYIVRDISTVTDFISYEKHRTVLANGLEFYWLEANYKDRPYKVQVSYQIFKELDRKGITVVDVEVLKLENGEEFVTYMKVRSDYKRLLEGN